MMGQKYVNNIHFKFSSQVSQLLIEKEHKNKSHVETFVFYRGLFFIPGQVKPHKMNNWSHAKWCRWWLFFPLMFLETNKQLYQNNENTHTHRVPELFLWPFNKKGQHTRDQQRNRRDVKVWGEKQKKIMKKIGFCFSWLRPQTTFPPLPSSVCCVSDKAQVAQDASACHSLLARPAIMLVQNEGIYTFTFHKDIKWNNFT